MSKIKGYALLQNIIKAEFGNDSQKPEIAVPGSSVSIEYALRFDIKTSFIGSQLSIAADPGLKGVESLVPTVWPSKVK